MTRPAPRSPRSWARRTPTRCSTSSAATRSTSWRSSRRSSRSSAVRRAAARLGGAQPRASPRDERGAPVRRVQRAGCTALSTNQRTRRLPRRAAPWLLLWAQAGPGGPSCRDEAEAMQRHHRKLLVVEPTGSRKAIGASQIEFCLGTCVQRRLAFTVELSAQRRSPRHMGEMLVCAGKEERVALGIVFVAVVRVSRSASDGARVTATGRWFGRASAGGPVRCC